MGDARALHLSEQGRRQHRISTPSGGSASGLPKDADGRNAIQGSPRDIQAPDGSPRWGPLRSWYMTVPMLLRAIPNAQVDKTQYSFAHTPGSGRAGHSSKWFVTASTPVASWSATRWGPPTLEQPQSVRIATDTSQARPYTIKADQ